MGGSGRHRFAGNRSDAKSSEEHRASVANDTAFAARRDRFVNELQPEVDRMKDQLDNSTAKGTVKTELEDTRARVKKLDSDLGELHHSSADDWWKISRDRVSDYIDRLEKSVNRLDDNKS